MKKLSIILLMIALTATFITGCTKENTKNPSTDVNVNDTTADKTGNNDSNKEADDTASESGNDNENTAPTETENKVDTNNSEVTVDNIIEAIRAAYGENYLPNMEIFPELLETEFGLTSDMYEEIIAEQPMISVHADRVVVVKAGKGRADDVEAALIAAKENKIKDTLQYPMNLPKISATKVVRNGDFVCFLLVGAVNDNQDATEEELKQFAEEEVQKGVNAFNDLFK